MSRHVAAIPRSPRAAVKVHMGAAAHLHYRSFLLFRPSFVYMLTAIDPKGGVTQSICEAFFFSSFFWFVFLFDAAVISQSFLAAGYNFDRRSETGR